MMPIKISDYRTTGTVKGLDDWYIEYAYAQKDSQGCSNSDDEKQYLVKMFLVSSKENNEVFRALQAGRNGVINTLIDQIKQEVFQLEKVVTRGCLPGKEEMQFYEICLICNGIRQGEDGVNYIYNELSLDRKREFFCALATAIFNIHQKKIIHANISAKSVAYAMNMPQKAYIAGFEYAFRNEYENRNQSGKLPVWWVRPDDKSLLRLEGQEFFSPELKKIVKNKKGLNELDFATDVYSLGLLFHLYLTGEMVKGLNEESLEINSRLKKAMKELLNAMLCENPDMRCTMEDVHDRLKKMNNSDFALDVNNNSEETLVPVKEEPVAEEKTESKTEACVEEAEKAEEKPESKTEARAEETEKTEAPIESETPRFEEAWPEHNLQWDIDAIQSKGYVRVERATKNGVKGYAFYKQIGGEPRFLPKQNVLAMKYAKERSKDKELAALKTQVWAEPMVQAYCAEKAQDKGSRVALKQKLEDAKKRAKSYASGYYLWIKEAIAPEKLTKDEREILEKCNKVLQENKDKADGVDVASLEKACEDISKALGQVRGLSLSAIPSLSVGSGEKTEFEAFFSEEDFDEKAFNEFFETLPDGEEQLISIDGDIESAFEIFTKACEQVENIVQNDACGIEEIFKLNKEAMEKDVDWDFVEEIANEENKLERAKGVIFVCEDQEEFEAQIKVIKRTKLQIKEYFERNYKEICRKINNAEIPVNGTLLKQIQRIFA